MMQTPSRRAGDLASFKFVTVELMKFRHSAQGEHCGHLMTVGGKEFLVQEGTNAAAIDQQPLVVRCCLTRARTARLSNPLCSRVNSRELCRVHSRP